MLIVNIRLTSTTYQHLLLLRCNGRVFATKLSVKTSGY